MPGPKPRPAAEDAARLERDVLEGLGLDDDRLAELGRHAPGTRRDLVVCPEGARVGATEDRAIVEFELPAGSYATVLLREITRESASDELRE
jgi:tRNA pseudouridine13 synthase